MIYLRHPADIHAPSGGGGGLPPVYNAPHTAPRYVCTNTTRRLRLDSSRRSSGALMFRVVGDRLAGRAVSPAAKKKEVEQDHVDGDVMRACGMTEGGHMTRIAETTTSRTQTATSASFLTRPLKQNSGMRAG
jgi:hypothetical protein